VVDEEDDRHRRSSRGSKNDKKAASPTLVFNLPGRGVLRFLDGGYRNPVHF